MLSSSNTSTNKTQRCLYFERGHCRKGKDCNFLHDSSGHQTDSLRSTEVTTAARNPEERQSQDLCHHFFTKGWCAFGAACHFSHSSPNTAELHAGGVDSNQACRNVPVSSGTSDLPVDKQPQQKEQEHEQSRSAQPGKNEPKLCKFYRSGYCRFGKKCRFSHEPQDGGKLRKVSPPSVSQSSDNPATCKASEKDDASCSPPVVQKPAAEDSQQAAAVTGETQSTPFTLSDEALCKMREIELKQLRLRYPRAQERTSEDGSVALTFLFEPTDPDWPYDVKQMKIEAVFPRRYPDEMMKLQLTDNERIPETVARFITESIQLWIAARYQAAQLSASKELIFRPLMQWFDRNAEDIMTQALQEYKRELVARSAGVQFIPASKLREIYPDAAKSTSTSSVDQTTSEVQNVDTLTENRDVELKKVEAQEPVVDVAAINEKNEEKTEICDDKPQSETSNLSGVTCTPPRKGTEVSLIGLQLVDGTATVVMAKITLIVICSRCTNSTELQLVPGRLFSAACTRCRNMQLVEFTASFAHQMSSVIGYLNLDGCRPFDLVLADSQLQIACISCSKDTKMDSLSPGQLNSTWCLHCHQKLTVACNSVRFVNLVPAGQLDASKAVVVDVKKPVKSVHDPAIQEGQPLPECGTCKHFRKSFRWFRFPCCGKAYPCDRCHDEKEPDHVMKLANRMICGFCCKEQPYAADRACISCLGFMTSRTTAHWEGGKGCRDHIKMSRHDAKKYANSTKSLSCSSDQKIDPSKKITRLRHV